MKPIHIVGTLFGGAGFVLFNHWAGQPIDITYVYAAFLVIGAVALGAIASEKSRAKQNDTMPNEIHPMEARKWVQRYLEETKGKRKIYVGNTGYESESLHERNQTVYINGQKNEIYGLVGKPEDPVTKEPQGGFVRIVFNLTEVKPLRYDNEIPATMEDAIKVDPLADISNITKAEGKITNEDYQPSTQGETIINVEKGDGGAKKQKKKEIDAEEDEWGSIEE